METYPCFRPSGKFTADSRNVRLAEYRGKNGTSIVAVSSFGHEGKTVLKSGSPLKEARDAETGKILPVDGNSVAFELKKNDFRLIQLR